MRIQDAEWIPGTIDFDLVYEHKITALVEKVEVVNEIFDVVLGRTKRDVVRTMKKGESIRGKIDSEDQTVKRLMAIKSSQTYRPVFKFTNFTEIVIGEVESDKIRVTCVPKEDDWIR